MSISKDALARKKRFQKIKDTHGGIHFVQSHIKNQMWNLWFNDEGDIVGLSKSPNEKMSKAYNVTQFTQDQIDMLTDNNWFSYRVRQDPKSEVIFYLEPKPIDSSIVSTNDFLYQVPRGKSPVYDLNIIVQKSKLIVKAHSKLLAEFDDIDLDVASARGHKRLPFYFTTVNDPSFMFHTEIIQLRDLLANKQVEVLLPADLRQCDVFTIKAFDKYIREE